MTLNHPKLPLREVVLNAKVLHLCGLSWLRGPRVASNHSNPDPSGLLNVAFGCRPVSTATDPRPRDCSNRKTGTIGGSSRRAIPEVPDSSCELSRHLSHRRQHRHRNSRPSSCSGRQATWLVPGWGHACTLFWQQVRSQTLRFQVPPRSYTHQATQRSIRSSRTTCGKG